MPYIVSEDGVVEVKKGPNKIQVGGELLTCHYFGEKFGFNTGTVHSRLKRIINDGRPYSHLFDELSKVHSKYRKNPNAHTIQMRETKKKEKIREEKVKQKRLTDNEEYYRQLRVHKLNSATIVGGCKT